MKTINVKYIEEQLEIKLPKFYVSTMLNYPFSEDSWGSEFSLCNDVEHVIELNKIFTNNNKKRFFIGSDGGGHYYFIKLNEERKVYFIDLENSEASVSLEANSWNQYLEQIEELHNQLKKEEQLQLDLKKNKKWWKFWV